MATYPTRYRLPVAYSTEIGRIITRWAFFEWRLKQAAYLLVKVDPKIGRVAIREPRVTDHITMIEDLARLRGLTLKVDWKRLRNVSGKIEAYRDRLAHGIWIRHPSTNVPALQETKGKYPITPGGPNVKARIDPRAVEVKIESLKDIVHSIDNMTATASQLLSQIDAQLNASPRKRP